MRRMWMAAAAGLTGLSLTGVSVASATTEHSTPAKPPKPAHAPAAGSKPTAKSSAGHRTSVRTFSAHRASGAPASAGQGKARKHPVIFSGAAALTHATLRPGTAPAGSNDWSCKPSAAHPRPVVLSHGTVENMTYNWYTLAPLLAHEGYCVYAFNYGQQKGRYAGLPGSVKTGGVAPIDRSAHQLAAFVRKVRSATGSSKVDIVGHSQGGMMPRYYLKYLGGKDKVDKLVGLAPSNHGTDVDGLARLPGVPKLLAAGLGPSVHDQIAGSGFMKKLNSGGDTVPGVHYTVIETRYDEIVTPYKSAFLKGPHTTDILLQKQCAADTSDHLGIAFDSIAARDVLNALDPAHAKTPGCHPTLPVNGG